MQVFIMWAGQSHEIAKALKEFLEFVVRGPKYFISDDIEGGRLWRSVLATQLESTSFGIACLTKDNLRSHWLHFEAGALSKAVGQANVVLYLIGPRTTDVEGPLADFQMLLGNEADTRKLVSLLATRFGETNQDVIEKSFKFMWPEFAKKLEQARTLSPKEAAEPARNEPALIREILDRIRNVERRMEPFQSSQPKITSDEPLRSAGDVFALLDSMEQFTTNESMDRAIADWRSRLKSPMLTLAEVQEIYRDAKKLEDFLNR